MIDLRLYIVHTETDAVWATDLERRLRTTISQLIAPANVLAIERRETIEDLPEFSVLEPLSLVLLVLPDQPFTEAEQRRLVRFREACGDEDVRLIPMAREAARNVPPQPLDDIKSCPLYDLNDTAMFERFATLVLNLLLLRVATGYRRIFISYRMKDGKPWAVALEQGLSNRGYVVWRDEMLDRDGQASITVGSPAQKTIERAILDQGFILVVDTLFAPESKWVHAEIDLSIAHLLPVLPVVIEDAANPANPKLEAVPQRRGGRFRQLRTPARGTGSGGDRGTSDPCTGHQRRQPPRPGFPGSP